MKKVESWKMENQRRRGSKREVWKGVGEKDVLGDIMGRKEEEA